MRPQMAELPKAESLDYGEIIARYIRGEIDLICVLGPTASGKTKYAVKLAQEICACRDLGMFEGCPFPMTDTPSIQGAEIISADSRQVYRGMDIGTGKDLAEYGEIPYHLIDIADAGSQYNVYEFQKDFIKAYTDIRSRHCIPILCGGTGLYLNSVISGYDFRSTKPLSELRTAGQSSEAGTAGQPGEAEGLPAKPFVIGTLVSREVRNERIDLRLDARLQEGMVDEIKGLLDAGVPAETLISYGLEYKFVTLYLLGQLSYGQMREQLAIAIHQFAKRQMTWFRGMERSGVRIHWVEV
ncbi:MAG: tRNA (adenosine(37)-N6)-dimethylallyltransferase [Candidatus Cryptobacteroides sp.]